MYLEKLGPDPNHNHTPALFPITRTLCHEKTLVPKKAEKKKRAKAPVKRRFKVRVIAQPMPTNPTYQLNLIPTVVNTVVTTQMPVAKSAAMAATSIPVTVYNLVQGKFEGIPYPTGKPQKEEGPLAPSCSNPRKDSNWKLQSLPQPNRTGNIPHGLIPYQLPTNLFDAKASWPIFPSREKDLTQISHHPPHSGTKQTPE